MTNCKASMLLILSANMRRCSIRGDVQGSRRIAHAIRRYLPARDIYQDENPLQVAGLSINAFACGWA